MHKEHRDSSSERKFQAMAEAGEQTQPRVSEKGAFEADAHKVLNSKEFRTQLEAVRSLRIAAQVGV